jgi:hypothetical protein
MSNEQGKKKSLTEEEVESSSAPVGRRAVMSAVSTLALGAGASQLAGCFIVPARGQPQTQYTYTATYQTGITDNDQGSYADQAGYGRGGVRTVQTGLTDSDNGSNGIQDPAGYGRGHYGYQGWTSGLTDNDGGAYADPAGNGRGTARMGNTGLTDSDGGAYADPAGQGRGRYR